ncbi:Outer dense fiber protein 3-B [Nibea albiflora]|uniref:Outer dense fiber protein 3-B n=1 Tax=Nibea albiflora TaxID=240163 RepID=A0ACB7FEG0_NIBAL|nr:Outer dense fiber protein 3-B [Nibea albiflora]
MSDQGPPEETILQRSALLQEELNSSDCGWALLVTESDPHVLSCLLWTWLDKLRDPCSESRGSRQVQLGKQRETSQCAQEGISKHDPTKYKAPMFSFGTRHDTGRSDCSPGPRYLIPSNITREGRDGTPAFSLHSRTKQPGLFQVPGPGKYSPEQSGKVVFRKAPAFSLSGRNKDSASDKTPGPASYSLPPVLGPKTVGTSAAPTYSLCGRSKTGSFHEDLKKTPGPAAYKVVNPCLYQKKPPQYSMTGRNFTPGEFTRTPGPGAHHPEQKNNSSFCQAPVRTACAMTKRSFERPRCIETKTVGDMQQLQTLNIFSPRWARPQQLSTYALTLYKHTATVGNKTVAVGYTIIKVKFPSFIFPKTAKHKQILSDAPPFSEVFDVQRKITYKNLANWYRELREYRPEIPCCVVANKIDADLKVTQRSFNFGKKQGLPFYFVSAADGTNVVKMFREMIKRAVDYKQNPSDFMDEVMQELENFDLEKKEDTSEADEDGLKAESPELVS